MTKTPQQIKNEVEKEEMNYRDWAYFLAGVLMGIALMGLWIVTGVFK